MVKSGEHGCFIRLPNLAAGTICIAIGVSLCARVVEASTTEYIIRPRFRISRPRFRALRLQKKMANLELPAYAIYNNSKIPWVRVSQRIWPPVPQSMTQNDETSALGRRLLLLSTVGAFLTLAGFVCQNIGTRELHWSAGVLQLGTTLMLAVLRAWLRRHVGRVPTPPPIALCSRLEASHLACHLEDCICGMSSKLMVTICPMAENFYQCH